MALDTRTLPGTTPDLWCRIDPDSVSNSIKKLSVQHVRSHERLMKSVTRGRGNMGTRPERQGSREELKSVFPRTQIG